LARPGWCVMSRTKPGFFCLLLVCSSFLITRSALCQEQAQWSTTLRLRDTARQAGYIFAGRVLSIKFVEPQAANEVATMRITFRVEQGLRGTRTGDALTIREWAGLWQGGERYRVGERVVLLLHPPSKLGLTSPVEGTRGRYGIDSQGNVVLGAGVGFEGPGIPARPLARIPLRHFLHAIRLAQAEE
jgi:hypothetical protein